MINLMEFVEGYHEVYEGFDVANLVSNTKTAINNKAEVVEVNWKFDYYTHILEKAINEFSEIKLNKNAVLEFVSNYKNSEKVNNAITPIKSTSDVVIKPQYISQYVEKISSELKSIVDENRSNIKGFNKAEVVAVKRQTVKMPEDSVLTNIKDLIKDKNSEKVYCDDLYIETTILPFLNNFTTIKKHIEVEANATYNAIKEAEISIKNMVAYCNTVKRDNNLDSKVLANLNLTSYHLLKDVIDVISYVTFIELRKLNTFTTNVITCNKLNDSLVVFTNVKEGYEDDIIVANDIESLTEQLINGNAFGYQELSHNIYNFNKEAVKYVDISDDSFESNYKDIYEDVIKDYIMISEGLNLISKATIESADGMILFDNIIKESGFSIVLKERFRGSLALIDDTSNLESSVNIATAFNPTLFNVMLEECDNYYDNMTNVAKAIKTSYDKLVMLLDRYENGINNEFKDLETINELKIFLKDLRNQFIDMSNIVAEKFFNRLKTLGRLLSNLTASNKANEMDSDEAFDLSVIESAIALEYLNITETEEAHKLMSIIDTYYIESTKEKYGLFLATEADTPQPAPATNTYPNQPNANPDKVTVTDNSKPDTSDGAKAAQGVSSETGKGIVEKFVNWITETLNKFIGNPKVDKNTAWLAANKQPLIDRSYANVQVNILPYSSSNVQNINADITKMANTINSFTPQMIQAVNNKSEMYQKLFTNIPGGVTEENLKEKLSNYYKTNTGDKAQAVNIANAELKNSIVNEIIPFCENYKTYQNNIKTESEALNRSIKDLLSKTSTVTESVMLEAENEPAKNTTTSMATKCSWITSAVQTMIGCILNGLSCKYNDYFKVLSSLAPKAPPQGKDVDNQIRAQQATQTTETQPQ